MTNHRTGDETQLLSISRLWSTVCIEQRLCSRLYSLMLIPMTRTYVTFCLRTYIFQEARMSRLRGVERSYHPKYRLHPRLLAEKRKRILY